MKIGPEHLRRYKVNDKPADDFKGMFTMDHSGGGGHRDGEGASDGPGPENQLKNR